MGIDWEEILDAEGEDLARAYDDSIPDDIYAEDPEDELEDDCLPDMTDAEVPADDMDDTDGAPAKAARNAAPKVAPNAPADDASALLGWDDEMPIE